MFGGSMAVSSTARWGWRVGAGCALLLGLVFAAQCAQGTIYLSKQEAMETAFGRGAVLGTEQYFLTNEQVTDIERIAQTQLESKLFTFFTGQRNGQLLGYAAIETHTVRTKPETLLVVLSPTGELQRMVVLAFHEPPEYQPPERWYSLLLRRKPDQLVAGRAVQAISGATLSSQAALTSARLTLAVFQVAVQGGSH